MQLFLDLSKGPYTLIAGGKRFDFEVSPFIGPVVLRKDGSPRKVQPSAKSPFWIAYNMRSHNARCYQLDTSPDKQSNRGTNNE